MNKKILLTIICILSVCALTLVTIKAYSLFESLSSGSASTELAAWKVKVNNTSLASLTPATRNFNLGQLSWTNANHVYPGKGAPGSIGTIDIVIDPDGTEVSFTYELTFDLSGLDNEEFQLYQITEESGDTIIRTGENTYTGIAYLSDIENDKEYEIEIQFIWNNSADNDDSDYRLGSRADEDIEIPITIRVKQYTGETIEEYQEEEEEEENNGENNQEP